MSELLNYKIRAREVLVIDENGTKLGVMLRNDAIKLAESKGLDLMEIATKANPPVCKILDYGKYKYDAKKKAKDAKANSTIIKVKTVKCKPSIEIGDLQIRANKIIKFLQAGNRVNFRVMVFGRYHQKKDWIKENILEKLLEMVSEYGQTDGTVRFERDIEVNIFPKKK